MENGGNDNEEYGQGDSNHNGPVVELGEHYMVQRSDGTWRKFQQQTCRLGARLTKMLMTSHFKDIVMSVKSSF